MLVSTILHGSLHSHIIMRNRETQLYLPSSSLLPIFRNALFSRLHSWPNVSALLLVCYRVMFIFSSSTFTGSHFEIWLAFASLKCRVHNASNSLKCLLMLYVVHRNPLIIFNKYHCVSELSTLH